ncbi:MAG: hypothetical protein WBQ26_00755 [Gemmatimonadaceae bacterium]|nr:hypothetical protein [Gemmatimonadaceae bacterium]
MSLRTAHGWWMTGAAIAIVVAGCSSGSRPTAPASASHSAALVVAANFQRLGDSVTAVHGDTDDAGRYYGAAAVLRRVPVFDTITIMVDHAPMTFDAVALAVDDTGSLAGCPIPPMDDDSDAQYECPWGMPRMTRTLFAWQPGDARHIVQIVALADTGAIGLPPFGRPPRSDTAGIAVPARLKYFDGAGGTWWGSAGSQSNSVTPNGQPCPAPADTARSDSSASPDRDGHHWGHMQMATVTCQMASFSFAFTGTVSVPPVAWARNTAAGSHSISLATSSVPGAYVTLDLAVKGP